jgi:hypothetical protein
MKAMQAINLSPFVSDALMVHEKFDKVSTPNSYGSKTAMYYT